MMCYFKNTYLLLVLFAMWMLPCMAQEPADSIATDSVTTDKHDPAEYLSGSLPVLYINTDGEKEIVSKEVYLKGTYYLDAMGIEGYENIGSAETPLALQIKGRGNTTWKFDKKPYRLKFDKKAAPLGMNKSKHFVLLANCEHNSLSLYKDVLGFWLSRQLGLKWTPAIKPVELVINGDYRGLYNLAEQVRVDPDRVNVVEQEDGETDPDLVTGGWLVEIDNYTEVGQVLIQSKKDGRHIRFTPKTPEELSDVQREYLTNLVTTIDSLINVEDINDQRWEEYIDLDALARYYLVNEVLFDVEAFNGSCYFHKQRGKNTKIVFGPVWDFGWAAAEWKPEQESYIYDNETVLAFKPNHWIGEIARFPRFQERVREHWRYFMHNVRGNIKPFLKEYYNSIMLAAKSDRNRWPQYLFGKAYYSSVVIRERIEQHVEWLAQQWGHFYLGDVNNDEVVNGADLTSLYRILLDGSSDEGYYPDINDDGVVNGADVTALYEILLGGE